MSLVGEVPGELRRALVGWDGWSVGEHDLAQRRRLGCRHTGAPYALTGLATRDRRGHRGPARLGGRRRGRGRGGVGVRHQGIDAGGDGRGEGHGGAAFCGLGGPLYVKVDATPSA